MAKNMELAFRIASKLDASVVGNFKKTSDEMKKMQEASILIHLDFLSI